MILLHSKSILATGLPLFSLDLTPLLASTVSSVLSLNGSLFKSYFVYYSTEDGRSSNQHKSWTEFIIKPLIPLQASFLVEDKKSFAFLLVLYWNEEIRLGLMAYHNEGKHFACFPVSDICQPCDATYDRSICSFCWSRALRQMKKAIWPRIAATIIEVFAVFIFSTAHLLGADQPMVNYTGESIALQGVSDRSRKDVAREFYPYYF